MQKSILLTGATDGIGLEAAKIFAEQGHNLLIHGRNAEKLKSAEALLAKLQNDGTVQSFISDFADLDSVKSMAANILDKHSKLDVIINNAGILKTGITITKNGLDIRFVVNLLAPFVLANALMNIIPTDGRIINLSSAAQAPIDLQALSGKVKLADMEAYSQSKLGITMWSHHLAKELAEGPLVVSVNPGSLLATKMVKEGFGIDGADIGIGADIIVRSALSNEFDGRAGQYYDNDAKQFGSPHPDVFDEAKAQAMLNQINKLV